ncbi:MAG: hypothetical protein ACOY16_07725 [Chloroflexota bacterium]
MRQNFAQRKRSGYGTKTSIAATATSWAIYGLAQQWSHEKNRLPVEAFVDQVLPLILNNLGIGERESHPLTASAR